MLRRCVIVSFIVALVATCLPVLTEESLELVNSGFEQTEEETVGEPSLDWEQTGAPPGWSAWFGSTARASNAEMVWTAGVAHSDSRSASVRSSDGPTVIMLTGGGGRARAIPETHTAFRMMGWEMSICVSGKL